jgi:hypothetical protein
VNCQCTPANTISLTCDAAITRGASYAFGLIPNEIVAPSTTATAVWPLSDCTLHAAIYRDASCTSKIIDFTAVNPSVSGDPILCSLTPEQTSQLPVTPEGSNFWVKALLTRAEGTVEPRGYGPVEIVA